MLLLIKNSKLKKHILVSLELLQSITKRSIQNKMAPKTLTVEYNPNDMVVVVIKEFGEQ